MDFHERQSHHAAPRRRRQARPLRVVETSRPRAWCRDRGDQGCPATPVFSTPVVADGDAPETARAFAQAHLCPEHGVPAEGAVLLLVGELVAHALLCGAPPVVVTLQCRVTEIRITVTDGSRGEVPGSHGVGPGTGADSSPHLALGRILVSNVDGRWCRRVGAHGERVSCTIPTLSRGRSAYATCRTS